VEEIERSAGSVEEAIEVALRDLGVTEQEAEVAIVQEPRGGFLGLSSRPAVVRVRVRADGERGRESVRENRAVVERAEEPDTEEPDTEEQAELGADFLDGLLAAMGVDADVEINDEESLTYLEVWGAHEDDDMGLLIGKRGHTLDALQEVVRSYIQRRTGERCRVLVDVEDYRKRRRSQLMRRARDAARQVQRSGRPEALEPMNAYERKLVHDTVAEVAGVETSSEGEEPNRRVVIRPAEAPA
jgi:spoIIIJ-associated protein